MRRTAAVLVVVCLGVAAATAQPSVRTTLTEGASIEWGMLDFRLEEATPAGAFVFDAPVWGLVYERQGLMAAVRQGWTDDPDGDIDLLDVTFALRGEPRRLTFRPFRGGTVAVPFGLMVAYRRVRQTSGQTEFITFEYTSFGILSGLGARYGAPGWAVDVFVNPAIGYATRSFGSSSGRLLSTDAGASVLLGPIWGRFGLLLGYRYQAQAWRVGGLDAFGAAGAGRVTYEGDAHALRIGVSW